MELNVFCDPTSWPPTFDGKPYTETQVVRLEQDSRYYPKFRSY